jgi:hypothetical protein
MKEELFQEGCKLQDEAQKISDEVADLYRQLLNNVRDDQHDASAEILREIKEKEARCNEISARISEIATKP